MTQQYYIRSRGQVRGPFTIGRLEVLCRRQRFGRHFEVSTDRSHWTLAEEHSVVGCIFPSRNLTNLSEQGNGTATANKQLDASSDVHAGDDSRNTLRSAAEKAAQANAVGNSRSDTEGPDDGNDLWYYLRGRQQVGPIDFQELRSLVASGELTATSCAWREGMDDWCELGHITDLLPETLTSRGPVARTINYDRLLLWVIWGGLVVLVVVVALCLAIGQSALKTRQTHGGDDQRTQIPIESEEVEGESLEQAPDSNVPDAELDATGSASESKEDVESSSSGGGVDS